MNDSIYYSYLKDRTGSLVAARYTFPLTVMTEMKTTIITGTIKVPAVSRVKCSHTASISATFRRYPAVIPTMDPTARMTRNS